MCRHFTRIDKINDGRVESKLKCPLARKPLQFFFESFASILETRKILQVQQLDGRTSEEGNKLFFAAMFLY